MSQANEKYEESVRRLQESGDFPGTGAAGHGHAGRDRHPVSRQSAAAADTAPSRNVPNGVAQARARPIFGGR
jgi:hypothetical protein